MKSFDYFTILRKYDILIASGIVIIISLILGGVLLLPNITKSQEIISQQTALSAKAQLLKKKDTQLTGLNGAYYKDSFPKLSMVLPQSKDFVNLFSTFDMIQSNTGVSITRTDFQLGSVSTASAAKQTRQVGIPAYIVPMRLEVIGTLDQLRNFFTALADYSGRLVTVDNVDWTALDNGGYKATFNGKAFYYPLPNTIGSLESPLPSMTKDEDEVLKKISQIELPQSVDDPYTDVTTGKKDLFH